MAQPNNLQVLQKPTSYLRLSILLLLALYICKVTFQEILPYLTLNKESYGRFWDYKWPLFFHISSGITAMLIGPFQFWKKFRSRYIKAHRLLGRIYLIAILIGTISATYLAWTSGYKISFSWAFGLQCLALAWIITASMAYVSVMRRRITQHKEWMTRSYVVTLGFFFFRILNNSVFVKSLMPEFKERGVTIIWFCWAIPLLITEIVINWKKK
ncbi:DUF2306 domain-containing protein [Lacibacter sediminis]|uniref:DUF2306 domain-containing protein n=1 Tax=Lacibacter sediminis TaxID=2760713 RepID=A0A7G5XGC2_9BACT|nr:DUF2306 domain-containing protein [Lacibacter sediminis]QNA44525.1 DUF2306 domain-containing protein [Lacibacter sediminis]